MEITCPKCSISIDVTEQMSKQLNQELETEKKLLVDKVRKDLEDEGIDLISIPWVDKEN